MVTANESSLALAATVTAVTVAFGVYMVWKKNKKPWHSHPPLKDVSVPTNWQRVGEVCKVAIYPLKSGAPLWVDKATCTEKGLKEVDSADKLSLQDRVFVVCNPSKNCQWVTMRINSKIVHVVTESVDKQTVKFSHPDVATSLIVKVPDDDAEANCSITMWSNEKGKAVDCGDEAAKWFSQTLLGKDNDLRLGCLNEKVPDRCIEGGRQKCATVYKRFRDEYFGVYSDLSSYTVLTESSVEDLNKRLKVPVTDCNFRANILVKGTKPYAEDSWEWIKIGEAIFHTFKPTTRCVLVTVSPITGIKDPEMQPLRALREYRLVTDPEEKKLEGIAPVLGQYLGLRQTGEIKVGDTVYAIVK